MSVVGARRDAQVFLSALQDAPLAFWRQMPMDWTPARTIGRLQGLNPQKTNARLRILQAAACIERRRRGRYVEYRPYQQLVLDQQIVRRNVSDGSQSAVHDILVRDLPGQPEPPGTFDMGQCRRKERGRT